jgi:hypothetical protein
VDGQHRVTPVTVTLAFTAIDTRARQRHKTVIRLAQLRRRAAQKAVAHDEVDGLAVRDRRLHDGAVDDGAQGVFEVAVEAGCAGVRVGLGEVVQHALAAGGVAHEDDPPGLAELGGFVGLDVLDALGDLIGVAVEVAEAPGLVGGGEVEREERPLCGLEAGHNVGDVRCGGQAVAETAEEEDAVWLGLVVGGEFECN